MTALIDARALWWHEAEECPHDPDEFDCDCWTEAGWDFNAWAYPFGLAVELDGVRYVTDARLLIREDLLGNWPALGDPNRPHLSDLAPGNVALTAAMLKAPVRLSATVARSFNPTLLGPLTAASYTLLPLSHDKGVHAVVAPDGTRVGLLMPTKKPVTL